MRVLFSTLIFLSILVTMGCVSAEARMQQGDAHFVSGHFSVALESYHDARRKDPSLPGIDEKIRAAQVHLFLQQGDAAVARGEWASAERAYGEVRRLEPANPDVDDRLRRLVTAQANSHFVAGQELLTTGNPFDAIREFEQCLAVQPDHPRAPSALERARAAKQEREERAETRFEEALRTREAGLERETLRLFAEVLELNPYHPSASRELAQARTTLVTSLLSEGDRLAQAREFVTAIEVYRSVLEVDPETPGVLDRIELAELEESADTLFAEGTRAFERSDWARAFELFDEASRLTAEPDRFVERLETARDRHATELYEQATVFQRSGEYRNALATYRRIARFHPSFGDVDARCENLSLNLPVAETAFDAGCHAQEVCDLVLAEEQFRVCARAIPGYRDVTERARVVRQGLARAQDFYDRALRGESRGDLQRARILFEECLTISNPFRDAAERLADLDGHFFDDDLAVPAYDDACRAHRRRDFETARRLYVVCDQSRPGYRDVTERLTEVEVELETARVVYRRAVAAEKRCDLPQARKHYEECLAICEPFSDARERLERIIVAQRDLEEAHDLRQQRKLNEARKCYQRVIDRCGNVADARDGIREIDAKLRQLAALHERMLVAEKECRYRLALSIAVQIQKQCDGYREIGARISVLEIEADYASGRALEARRKYDAALRCFRRCAERSPGFKDVEGRMRRLKRLIVE